MTVQLIGIGRVEGISAGEIKAGMHIMYNYGSVYEVLSAEPFKQSTRISAKSVKSGEVYTCVYRQSKPMAAYWPKTGGQA